MEIEYRSVIGEEQRDQAYINKKDTKNFALVGHEVPYGAEFSEEKTIQEYQEEDGVFLISKFK